MQPPVVQTLDALCNSSPVCGPQRMRRLRAQVTKLERKVAKYKAILTAAGLAIVESESDSDSDDEVNMVE